MLLELETDAWIRRSMSLVVVEYDEARQMRWLSRRLNREPTEPKIGNRAP